MIQMKKICAYSIHIYFNLFIIIHLATLVVNPFNYAFFMYKMLTIQEINYSLSILEAFLALLTVLIKLSHVRSQQFFSITKFYLLIFDQYLIKQEPLQKEYPLNNNCQITLKYENVKNLQTLQLTIINMKNNSNKSIERIFLLNNFEILSPFLSIFSTFVVKYYFSNISDLIYNEQINHEDNILQVRQNEKIKQYLLQFTPNSFKLDNITKLISLNKDCYKVINSYFRAYLIKIPKAFSFIEFLQTFLIQKYKVQFTGILIKYVKKLLNISKNKFQNISNFTSILTNKLQQLFSNSVSSLAYSKLDKQIQLIKYKIKIKYQFCDYFGQQNLHKSI
ncbi:hypothetical protein pb186bvf_017412 [Paramecium bursaria]